MNKYQILIYLGIIIIALSIVIRVSTELDTLGNVVLAVGGLLLIAGMALKRKVDKKDAS